MKNIFPQHEKKMVYSIRSLKNGTGSVLIGASFILFAMKTIPLKLKKRLKNLK